MNDDSQPDDKGDTLDLPANRFANLQAAVDYIDMTNSDAKTPKIELPTLGHLLSVRIKYALPLIIENAHYFVENYGNLFDFQWELDHIR